MRGWSPTGAVSTTIGMGVLIAAVRASSVPLLVAAALPARAGQGMGQLGGLSSFNSSVPPGRLTEANAALDVGAHVPAGVLPVTVGYLGDAVGLTTGATVFGPCSWRWPSSGAWWFSSAVRASGGIRHGGMEGG